MADVKWIKITTDVFDDEKILMIESMPSADSIIVIWFKLLAFAGRQNNDGVFLMSNRIAYTDEMLASIFRRDVNVVRLALSAFEQFGMIEIIDGVITIPNWNKHQTLDAYEKKKERDRIYQQERRAAQRALIEKSSDKSSDSKTTQSSYVAVSEEDKEKDIEIDKDNIILSDSDEPEPPAPKPKRKKKEKKEEPEKTEKHEYGEFKNVLLTDEELQKLKTEYSDYEERIEKLSSYMESKGKTYKSHYATIRSWARKDAEKQKPTRQEIVPSWLKNKQPGFNDFMKNDYDIDELERELLSNGEGFEERKEALQNRLKEKYGKGK